MARHAPQDASVRACDHGDCAACPGVLCRDAQAKAAVCSLQVMDVELVLQHTWARAREALTWVWLVPAGRQELSTAPQQPAFSVWRLLLSSQRLVLQTFRQEDLHSSRQTAAKSLLQPKSK